MERPTPRRRAALAGLCVLLASFAAHGGALTKPSPDTRTEPHAWLGSFCTTRSCQDAPAASPWASAAFAATVAAIAGVARRRETGV